MTERVTDLQLREQTDGYNRKNVLLWFLTVASIVILSVLGGGLLIIIIAVVISVVSSVVSAVAADVDDSED